MSSQFGIFARTGKQVCAQIQNDRGASLVVLILAVSAVVILGMTAVITKSQSLNTMGTHETSQSVNTEVAHDLQIIFSNPKLCQQAQVYGNRFWFNPAAGHGHSESSPIISTYYSDNGNCIGGKLKVTDMTVTPQSSNLAKFNVTTSVGCGEVDSGVGTRTESVLVRYQSDSSGHVTSCQMEVAATDACSQLGLVLGQYTVHGQQITTTVGGTGTALRCPICEKMGGTWTYVSLSENSTGGAYKCITAVAAAP